MRMLTCGLFLALTLLAPTPADSGDFKLEPGFTLLFNGKNLDGWRQVAGKKDLLDGKTEANNGRFKVADGIIQFDAKIKGDQYIETTKEFGKDVHIKFDFKPGAGCNNDIFLRGTKFDIVPGKGETKAVKEGEWQLFEIVVEGDKIEHKINGAKVRSAKTKAGASPFKLRAEFGSIQVKNIRAMEGK